MGKWVHRLNNINEETKTAFCQECGSVRVYRDRQRWICSTPRKAVVKTRDQKPHNKTKIAKRVKRRDLNAIGWTPEMKEIVIALQNGKCANPACNKQAFAADHDHEFGEARGVLCWSCNVSLGHLKEDPDLIRGLAEYAEQCLNVKCWN